MPTGRDNSPALYDYEVDVEVRGSRGGGGTITVERSVEAAIELSAAPGVDAGEVRVTSEPPVTSNLESVRSQLRSSNNVSSALGPLLGNRAGISQSIAEDIISTAISDVAGAVSETIPDIQAAVQRETIDVPGGSTQTVRDSVSAGIIVPIPEGTDITKNDVVDQITSAIPTSEVSLGFDASEQIGTIGIPFVGGLTVRDTNASVDITVDVETLLNAFIDIERVSINCREAGFDPGEELRSRVSDIQSEISSVESELNSIRDEIEQVVGQDIRSIRPSDIKENITEFGGRTDLSGGVGTLLPSRPGGGLTGGTDPLSNLRTRLQNADPRDINVPEAAESPNVPIFCRDISQADVPDFASLRATQNNLVTLFDTLNDLLQNVDIPDASDCPDASQLTAVPNIDVIPTSQEISLEEFADRIGVVGNARINIPQADVQRQGTADALDGVVSNFRDNLPSGCPDPDLMSEVEAEIQRIRTGDVNLGRTNCATAPEGDPGLQSDIVQFVDSGLISDLQSRLNNQQLTQVSQTDVEQARSRLNELESEIDAADIAAECDREYRSLVTDARETVSEVESQLGAAGGEVTSGTGCASRFEIPENQVSSLEDLIGVEGNINMAPLTSQNANTVGELSEDYIRTTTIPEFVISDAENRIASTRATIQGQVDDPGCAREFNGRLDRVQRKFNRIVSTVNAEVDCISTYPDAECAVSGLENVVGIGRNTIKVGGFGDSDAGAFSCRIDEDTEIGFEKIANAVPNEKRPLPEPSNVADMRRVLREEGVEFRTVLPEVFEQSLRSVISRTESFAIDPDNLNRGVDTEACIAVFNGRLQAVKQQLDNIVTAGEGVNIVICGEEYSNIDSNISDLETRVTRETQLSQVEDTLSNLRASVSNNVEEDQCIREFNRRLDSIRSAVRSSRDSDGRTGETIDGGGDQDGGRDQLDCSDVPRQLRNAVRSYEEATTTFLQTPQLSNNQEDLTQETQDRLEEGQELLGRIQENVSTENPCRGELINDVQRSMQRLQNNLGQESVRVEVEEAEGRGGPSGQRIEEILANIGGGSGTGGIEEELEEET